MQTAWVIKVRGKENVFLSHVSYHFREFGFDDMLPLLFMHKESAEFVIKKYIANAEERITGNWLEAVDLEVVQIEWREKKGD